MINSAAQSLADATRRKVLGAAFAEFYRNGFQGGGVNRIVEAAGVTKGALFHHFASKQALGYAVVDEMIGPLLMQRWLDPLEDSTDPIGDIKRAFRRFIHEDIDSGAWVNGCPLNNLAQEMSPLDEGFRTRIETLYARWRNGFAAAITKGIEQGIVRSSINARDSTAFIVVAQMGIWGTGKYSRNESLMIQSGEALCDYLDALSSQDVAQQQARKSFAGQSHSTRGAA
jgi:AcrR family transcriptional regulator